ncbi:hypothetical protein V1509DRAFT_616014 [Lipomyces kononenkoae]
MNFAIVFLDIDPTLTNLWKHYLERHLPHVRVPRHLYPQIVTASITALPANLTFDCIVSPGNSFARMDGGLDLYISRMFAGSRTGTTHTAASLTPVLQYVQKVHHERWKGLQPVGSCYIIDMLPFLVTHEKGSTDNKKGSSKTDLNPSGCRYIAHTPTMRVPTVIDRDEVVYDCMWAALNEIYNHNSAIDVSLSSRESRHTQIGKVAVSGLGTGTGNINMDTCAELMVLAYVHFLDAIEKGQDCTAEWSWRRAKEWDRIITNRD